jgi:hypothetical protein
MRAAAVFVATYESRSFDFMAVGLTPKSAMDAMMRGAVAHSNGVGVELASWFDVDGVNVVRLWPGDCARDGQIISESIGGVL